MSKIKTCRSQTLIRNMLADLEQATANLFGTARFNSSLRYGKTLVYVEEKMVGKLVHKSRKTADEKKCYFASALMAINIRGQDSRVSAVPSPMLPKSQVQVSERGNVRRIRKSKTKKKQVKNFSLFSSSRPKKKKLQESVRAVSKFVPNFQTGGGEEVLNRHQRECHELYPRPEKCRNRLQN